MSRKFLLLFTFAAALLLALGIPRAHALDCKSGEHLVVHGAGDSMWEECVSDTGSGAGGAITTFAELVSRVSAVLNTVVPLVVGLAVLVIVWGIFRYISEAGDEEKRREARQFVIWGIIGLFFILAIWGFVGILDRTFTLNKEIPNEFPHLPAIPQ